MYKFVRATKKIAALNKRIRAVQGGTGASKTVSIVLYLIHLAQSDTKPTLTSIVSESFPHLKRGAMRDFLLIMNEHEYFKEDRWNKTDFTYTFETGSKIEFFSVDQPGKVRGPRRDRLFINEVNNISYETFDQLEIRTNEFIYLDWNPVSEFWFYDEVLGVRSDVDHIILTYMDNEGLNRSVVESIELHRNNQNWWKVYGEGELGDLKGKIYTGWRIIDEVPHEARLERYGLNFGYTNHPAAIIAIYYYNKGYIIDEIAYGRGMLNRVLADYLKVEEKALVIADSAEPKSIDEMKEYQIDVVPAEKGKDSVNYGIGVVQDQRMSITKRSVNVIKEYRNYLWMIDKNGKTINVPQEPFHYSMDAVRYAIVSLVQQGLPDPKQEQAILDRHLLREVQKKDTGL